MIAMVAGVRVIAVIGGVLWGVAACQGVEQPDVATLVAELRGTDPQRAGEAARTLGRLKGELAIMPLVEALSDTRKAADNPSPAPDRLVSAEAAAALVEIGEPAAVALASGLAAEKDPATQRLMIETLGRMGGHAAAALPQLESLSQSKLPRELRYALLEAYGRIKPHDAAYVTFVARSLHDKSADVRGLAARMLGRAKQAATPAVGDLATLLDDKGKRWQWVTPDMAYRVAVRADAAEALGLIGPAAAAAIDPLRERLAQDDDVRVRVAAALALYRIDDKSDEALSALIGFLSDRSDGVAGPLAAARALEHLGPAAKPALEPLEKCLQDKSDQLRLAAMDALAAIGGKDAIPVLRIALEDRDRYVRDEAARIIDELQKAP